MALAASTAPVAGQPPTPVAPVAVTPKPGSRNDPNRRVCKDVPRPQSRFVDRTCGTQAEWDERERLDRQAMQDNQGRTTPAPIPGQR